MNRYTIAIHGGAGTINRGALTPQTEAAYQAALTAALTSGYQVLEEGGAAREAVKIAVMSLEDHPLFNAGRGAVFTNTGTHELDASIMDGCTGLAGAVGAVTQVRNPIALAEAVLLHSEHVLLVGAGALEFARQQQLPLEPDRYFYTEQRYAQWQQAMREGSVVLDHSQPTIPEKKFGTVGAVACDRLGNLAAATSTGGMTNKKFGRVGDTPVIGAGTYANNKTCAISCTGHGEVFLRAVAAYDVSALMEYRQLTLRQAMEEVVLRKLVALNGEGGMIAVDSSGEPVLLFNSAGMYRGFQCSDGRQEVGIF